MKKFIGSEGFWGGLLIVAAIIVVVMLLSSCGDTGGALLVKQIPGPQGDIGDVGSQGVTGVDGSNGLSCKVEQTAFGAAILCEDGSQANIYNGKDGVGCSIEQTDTGAIVTCGDNTVTIANGQSGQDGEAGLDGSSCSAVVMLDNSKFVVCTDGSNFQLFDGLNGTNGQDSIIAIIDPCGKQSNTDEIFLKLSTGQTIAVYDDMSINKIHLVQLVEGTWITTDTTHCYFSVDENGDIFNEHN